MPKTDLRRCTHAQQLQAVRRYAYLRGRDPMGDPYVTPADIERKFRTICPLALFRAYEDDCVARFNAHRDAAAERVLTDIQAQKTLLGPYQGAEREFAQTLARAGWLTAHVQTHRFTRTTADAALYAFGAHKDCAVSSVLHAPNTTGTPLPVPLALPPDGTFTEIVLREDRGLPRGEHHRTVDKLRTHGLLVAYARDYERVTGFGDEGLTTYILVRGDVTPHLPRNT